MVINIFLVEGSFKKSVKIIVMFPSARGRCLLLLLLLLYQRICQNRNLIDTALCLKHVSNAINAAADNINLFSCVIASTIAIAIAGCSPAGP